MNTMRSGTSELGHDMRKNLAKINLYNFESPEAINCPYILTSPRSLKACSSSNIKPIELLHRSASEIAKDLNLSIQNVHHIYEDYERERLSILKKLSTLLTCIKKSTSTIYMRGKFKGKLGICRLVRKHMLRNCEIEQSQKFSTNPSLNIFSNREIISRASNYSRGETPEFLHLKERKSRSSYSSPATPVSRCRSFNKEKTSSSSFRCDLSSSSSSISSFIANLDGKRSKSVDCEKYKKFGLKKLFKRNTMNSKNKSNKYSSQLKNEIGIKYQMSEAEKLNDEQLCSKIDNVKKFKTLSENQENIHRSAAVLKTKNSKNKLNIIEQNNFSKNCEKVINRKQERLKPSKNKKIAQNGTKFLPKPLAVDFENNVKTSNESVKNNDLEGSKRECEKQIEELGGLKNHDLRILDAMALKRELQKTQDNFVQRARVVWATPPIEVQLNSSLINLFDINNDSKQRKTDCCHFPENMTFETYFNHIRNKMKQMKEDSLQKELHGEHVRQLARELQLGMEQWQDQVLLLQWQTLQRARNNAKLHIENKRLKTQYENNERALLHALRLKNIQNMEKLKQLSMKKEIEEKDGKIKKLKMKREREILDCRAQAHYTAALREQLRRTLTPETFDQKVNDVIIKTRFANRSLTASPFVESHIRLG